MRVCQVDGSVLYLTSSCETEMVITGWHSCNNKSLKIICTNSMQWQTNSLSSTPTTGYHKGQPYVSDPTVKNFIQWTKTLKDNTVLQRTAVGGYYCYPHPPKMFTQSMADASGEGKHRVVHMWAYLFIVQLSLFECMNERMSSAAALSQSKMHLVNSWQKSNEIWVSVLLQFWHKMQSCWFSSTLPSLCLHAELQAVHPYKFLKVIQVIMLKSPISSSVLRV